MIYTCDENVYIENSSLCLSVHRKMMRGRQEPQHTAGLYSVVSFPLRWGQVLIHECLRVQRGAEATPGRRATVGLIKGVGPNITVGTLETQ